MDSNFLPPTVPASIMSSVFYTYPCKNWNVYPECPQMNYQPNKYCQYCIVRLL